MEEHTTGSMAQMSQRGIHLHIVDPKEKKAWTYHYIHK